MQAPLISLCPICWWQSQKSCLPCRTLCSPTRPSGLSPLCVTSLTASWLWSSAGPNTFLVRNADNKRTRSKCVGNSRDAEDLWYLNKSQQAVSGSLKAITKIVININVECLLLGSDQSHGTYTSLSRATLTLQANAAQICFLLPPCNPYHIFFMTV